MANSTSLRNKNINFGASITVKEARKILGKQSASLDDNQVQDIIVTLTLMARKYLTSSSSKITLGKVK